MQTQPFFIRGAAATALATAVLALAACGGGGGDGPKPNPDTGVIGLPTPGMVASNYLAGSEELAAFNLLNAERERCGFGVLAQSNPLDLAARGHADYQIVNNLLTHVQDRNQFPRGFTGTEPLDRVQAAGYSGVGGVTDEIVGYSGTTNKAGLGADGIRGLLSAPYHLRGLVAGYRDIGLSVRSSADLGVNTRSVYVQINAAYKSSAGPQRLAAGDVKTYPCEGTTGINFRLSNETPNPIPNRDLAVNPLGAVVYVGGREGSRLDITSSVLTELSSGRAVVLRAPVGGANDPYAPCLEGCFKSHEAYIAADAPVTPNAAYQMVVNGTLNGMAFSRSFTFRTGAGG